MHRIVMYKHTERDTSGEVIGDHANNTSNIDEDDDDEQQQQQWQKHTHTHKDPGNAK